MSMLVLLLSTVLGTDMVSFHSALPEDCCIQLTCDILSSNATSSLQDHMVEEHGDDESDATTVQRMRELGHLQLSTSDCASAERWFLRARTLLEHNAANASLAAAVNATQLEDLEHAALLGDHGFALVCANRFTDGIETLRSALQNLALPHAQPHLLNALGFALFQLREYNEAEEAFLAAVKANPMNPLQWNNVASASNLAGHGATAQHALERALRLVQHLGPAARGYYEQLISNNVHVFRGDAPQARPSVEIFYCAPREVAALARTKKPEDFQETLKAVIERVGEPVNVPALMDAREALLALHPEPVVCL